MRMSYIVAQIGVSFEQISQDDHDDVFQNLARDAGSKILDGSYTYSY